MQTTTYLPKSKICIIISYLGNQKYIAYKQSIKLEIYSSQSKIFHISLDPRPSIGMRYTKLAVHQTSLLLKTVEVLILLSD